MNEEQLLVVFFRSILVFCTSIIEVLTNGWYNRRWWGVLC